MTDRESDHPTKEQEITNLFLHSFMNNTEHKQITGYKS